MKPIPGPNGELNNSTYCVPDFVRKGVKVAYCAQNPFVIHATVRENITFGEEFDQEKYDNVLSFCCLNEDLQQLPQGDATEIGERGINLSGGQKMRIALARVIYSR